MGKTYVFVENIQTGHKENIETGHEFHNEDEVMETDEISQETA